jgi:hypothetical protein
MTKDLQTMRDRSWNFEPDELLYAYVGQSYSWSDMDQIVAEKSQHEARHVAAMLELAPADTVLDIGSNDATTLKACTKGIGTRLHRTARGPHTDGSSSQSRSWVHRACCLPSYCFPKRVA